MASQIVLTQHEEDATDDPGPEVDCYIGVRVREDEFGVVLHQRSHLLNTLSRHDGGKQFYNNNNKVIMVPVSPLCQ